MGQRYPSIEIVRKKDFYTKNLKSQMFVNFAGQRIGEISLSRPTRGYANHSRSHKGNQGRRGFCADTHERLLQSHEGL